MNKTKKTSVNVWLPIVFVLVVIGIFFWYSKQKIQEETSITSIQKTKEVSAYKPLPEATNSEGNLKLVGTSRRSAEGRIAYVFKVVDSQKDSEIPIYETIADPGNSISIPRNSWSPDYKQVFIKTSSPTGENYYLFRSDGQSYANGEKFIIVGNYWDTAKMTSKIRNISGWAGNDLLMVYTLNDDGSEGPAYWFVTSSRKFMQVREF